MQPALLATGAVSGKTGLWIKTPPSPVGAGTVRRRVLSNQDLEKLVDTNDEWIQSRTGIRERRIAAPGETTSTMATIAARQALKEAELSARDLDLIICATTTPDQLIPGYRVHDSA